MSKVLLHDDRNIQRPNAAVNVVAVWIAEGPGGTFRDPDTYFADGPETFVVNVRAGPCWTPWNLTTMV
jgi:hypothetical protein